MSELVMRGRMGKWSAGYRRWDSHLKKLPEPTPMYHDEEGGTKERHRPCHGGKGSHPIQALIH